MRFDTLFALMMGCALSLSLQPPALAAGKATVPGWQSAAGKTDEMVFVATGDSIINRRLSTESLPGAASLFDLIRGADAAFTNFETQIHDFDLAGAQQSGGTYMGSPHYVTDELAWAGFDLLGVANNHANDYGVEGLRSTLAALAKTNFAYAGAGENLAMARRPGYLDTPKGRVALISVTATFPEPIAAGAQRPDMRGRPGVDPLHHSTTYTVTQETFDTLSKLRGKIDPNNMGEGGGEPPKEGTLKWAGATYVVGPNIGESTKANKKDLEELVAEVRNARRQADWVMVSIHAHESATPDEKGKPAQFTVEFAHAVIDAGADMFVAHGPHILRGIEVYKGKPIFYSMGNFIFENDLVELQPADNYEKTGLGDDALPADYYDKRSKNDTVGFPHDRKYWQSVVAETVFTTGDRSLKEIRLHPISMGFGQPRIKRGQPYPSPQSEADHFHGQERPAVRVRLDPDKVAQLGLTLEDIRSIIAVQTVNSPKGSLTGPDRAVIVDATDQVMTADAYKSIVVAYKQGGPIRLEDLGTVLDAPEDIQQAAWVQGKRAIVIDVHKQIGYNVVETIDQIKERLPQLAAALPPAATLSLVGDRTQTIRAAVTDVQVTLLITIVLVVLVIFFFVRNLWATVIPSVAIPLSLVSAFGVMYALDYSLDNISLMGMTIAVGFVVDDAIVVVENVMRHVEDGKSPVRAAIEGSREVSFTIISMTVSLIAVFIPILLMGGIIGRLFREFAVTVTVVILMSGVVSLTVTPMMCAWLIRHDPHARHGRVFEWSEHLFNATTVFYQKTLDKVLAHPVTTLLATLATLILSICLYVVTPKGFFPTVDTGFISGTVQAAPDISFEAMSRRMEAIGRICSADPDVEATYYWIGNNPTMSQGRININLKPAELRHATATEIMARLKKRTAGVAGATLFMQVRQDIQMGGRVTATQYQYTLQDGDIAELTRWSQWLLEKFSSMPELRDVSSDAQSLASNITIRIDRDTASRLGVSAQAIDDVLYDAFGQRQIATLFTQLNQYHVIEEIDPRYQVTTDSLSHLYVRASNGGLVPLSVLASVQPGLAPITINHQGLFPAITLSFNLAPGMSLGQAVDSIRAIERDANIPPTLTTSFQGTARAFQDSLRTQPWLIFIALVAVYIVLGVLYESAIHPLTIISTLPSAGVGALVALLLCGQDLSIMGMVGIILLIGIVKKNAIMIIDFSLAAEREEGMAPLEAIRQGCLLRFRPIMMTTLAALFGAVPLALGSGVGAELRVPLGIAIIGGLIVSQVLTLYATPVIYLWMARVAKPSGAVQLPV